MPLIIPSSHPSLQLTSKVSELCAPFFTQHGFNFFHYGRYYENGAVSLLVSDSSLFLHFLELDFPSFSTFKEEHQHQHSYWYLWDEELPWLPVKIARDYHNLHHGVTLLRRSLNYYELIAVAMPEQRLNAASYYISRLKAIEQFIRSFEQTGKDLLTKVICNPIALPEINWDKNIHKLILKKERLIVKSKKGITYITPQELACLSLLIYGHNYKETASALSLSRRTVETYIARAKARTGLSSKSALRDMLSMCP